MTLRRALDFSSSNASAIRSARKTCASSHHIMITDRVVSLGVLAAGLVITSALLSPSAPSSNLAPDKMCRKKSISKNCATPTSGRILRPVQIQVRRILDMLSDSAWPPNDPQGFDDKSTCALSSTKACEHNHS